jgi:4a-hydroxytetrahydrobiopterin dehydratase
MWQSDGKSIHRKLQFADYWETIAFVNALAWVIHGQDHHPEMKVGYDTVELRFDTHSVGGISMNDFICAARCNALYAERPKARGT